MNNTVLINCPCGSQRHYKQCCAPLHNGTPAPDAERLMRSRYSAYVLQLGDYLFDTWAVETRPERASLTPPPSLKWLRLTIVRHETNGESGIVEFIAQFKDNGRAGRLHEISHFIQRNGYWFYVNGEFPSDTTG